MCSGFGVFGVSRFVVSGSGYFVFRVRVRGFHGLGFVGFHDSWFHVRGFAVRVSGF